MVTKIRPVTGNKLETGRTETAGRLDRHADRQATVKSLNTKSKSSKLNLCLCVGPLSV